MSVILGIRTNKKVIIAADKRTTAPNGDYTDDSCKIYVVSAHLAFATMGGAAQGYFIDKAINLYSYEKKQNMSVENLGMNLCAFYEYAKTGEIPIGDLATFRCVFGGKNDLGTTSLYCCFSERDKLVFLEKDACICQPKGMHYAECVDIFNDVYINYTHEFPERVISEVALRNGLVSPTGDKWVYDVGLNDSACITF